MSPAPSVAGRWRRIEQILDAALALPDHQRPAFLEKICASDDQLRQDLENLLNDDGDDDFQDSPLISRIIEDATAGLLSDEDRAGEN